MGDQRAYKLGANAFKALAHPTRIAILEMMRNGPICSCKIEPLLGLRQSNIAQHLGILRDSQLVTSYRDGIWVMYAATDPRLFQVVDVVNSIMHGQMEEAALALAVAGEDAA